MSPTFGAFCKVLSTEEIKEASRRHPEQKQTLRSLERKLEEENQQVGWGVPPAGLLGFLQLTALSPCFLWIQQAPEGVEGLEVGAGV